VENAASRWEPEGEDDCEAANAELKERFATTVANKGLAVDPDAPEGLLHHNWGYVDGHLTRWPDFGGSIMKCLLTRSR